MVLHIRVRGVKHRREQALRNPLPQCHRARRGVSRVSMVFRNESRRQGAPGPRDESPRATRRSRRPRWRGKPVRQKNPQENDRRKPRPIAATRNRREVKVESAPPARLRHALRNRPAAAAKIGLVRDLRLHRLQPLLQTLRCCARPSDGWDRSGPSRSFPGAQPSRNGRSPASERRTAKSVSSASLSFS